MCGVTVISALLVHKLGQGSSIVPNLAAPRTAIQMTGPCLDRPPKWLIKTDYHSWRI